MAVRLTAEDFVEGSAEHPEDADGYRDPQGEQVDREQAVDKRRGGSQHRGQINAERHRTSPYPSGGRSQTTAVARGRGAARRPLAAEDFVEGSAEHPEDADGDGDAQGEQVHRKQAVDKRRGSGQHAVEVNTE